MQFKNQLIEFTEKYSLKEKALASVDKVIDASIESDKEIGIDFLEGQDRKQLIYEFGRFEFQIDKNDNDIIVTRINIYSKKLYGQNCDVPVGYYIELTDLEGNHIDEFLNFDWSPINFNIDYYIERINKIIPQRYFRRNIPEYEFATYTNHIISLFQGKQYTGVVTFIKRCLDYLEKTGNKEIEKEYLYECLDLYKGICHFIKKNDVEGIDLLTKYDINERIKTKS